MTQLLISIMNVQEASIAIAHGADIIDLKDPKTGALGALPITTIKCIVDFMNGARPTSATVGDLPAQNSVQVEVLVNAVLLLVETNVDFIKIGFYVTEDYQPCLSELKNLIKMCLPKTVKLIAVLFAEYDYPAELTSELKKAGFVGVMIDTAIKNGKIYSDYQSFKITKKFADEAILHNLSFGLAGSLSFKDIGDAKRFSPTYLGFRGGVCDRNTRQENLNIQQISEIRNLI